MRSEAHRDIRELLEKSGVGDEDAFKQIYDRLNGRVFSYILARSHSREDALDILQNVFVDVWLAVTTKKFSYLSDGQFYRFVFLIAKRRLGKYYRSYHETIEFDERYVADMYEARGDELHDFQSLQKEVSRLKDVYREVLELRYWSQLSFKEIADVLKSTESAVKVRHHRAIEKLRQIIHEHDQ